MTYDPEFHLNIERMIDELVGHTNNIKENLGEDHAISRACSVVDSLFLETKELLVFYDSTFDDDMREEIKKKVLKNLTDADDLWAEIGKTFDVLLGRKANVDDDGT